MKMFWRLGALALLLTVGHAYADDTMRQELEDLRAKVASLESAQMAPAAGGDAMSLTSMKKKGAIKIGGDVEVAIRHVLTEDEQNEQTNNALTTGIDTSNGEDDQVNYTLFDTQSACLMFDIAASKDSGLKIKLDIDDFWNSPAAGNANQDDLLEEVYFYWKNIRGSNFDINFGKKEVAFGQDMDILLLGAITNTIGHSYLMASHMEANHGAQNGTNAEGATDAGGDGAFTTQGNNPIDRVSENAAIPGEIDNVFQIQTTYHWKDLLKVDFTVFQDDAGRGMNEDRSDDSLFFESWALKATVTPLEGLETELSYVTRHNESAGDETTNPGALEDTDNCDETNHAVSFGANYKLKSIPLMVFGEYVYGWDGADNVWNDDYDINIAQIGAKYGLTENIDLIFVGGWLQIENEDSNNTTTAGANGTQEEEETLWSTQLGVQYKLDNGMIFSLEWQHEWFDAEYEGVLNPVNPQVGDIREDRDASADTFVFGTKWTF